MIIHLFGSSTPAGQALKDILFKNNFNEVYEYSRKFSINKSIYCDMVNPDNFNLVNKAKKSIIISFAPIWVTSYFLNYLMESNKDNFKKVEKILVCSSSSVLTKKFSFNNYDKELVETLSSSENILDQLSKSLRLQILVIQPSMIYGSFAGYKDKNFSKILRILRLFPLILLPKNTGLRQPISCYQLANIFFNLIINENLHKKFNNSRLVVGGDKILTYREMLIAIKNSTKSNDPSRICLLLTIPDKLFMLILTPIIIFSPKVYEACLRIFSDLANFKYQKNITGEFSLEFPDKKIKL